jgi:RNA polymerase subunit RPABC4/transcription elongation factor Spt4
MHGPWVVVLVLLVVVGSAGLLAVVAPAAPSSPARAAASGPSALAPALTPPTHGDLIVKSGQTYTIQPTLGGHVYYQGGNITVDSGGTLIVRNVTLSFVEYVADTGTALQRLSHIYTFLDNGTVDLFNSTVTTDVQVLNAYAKLNLTVTGVLNGWNATIAFPGWVNVLGPRADVTLNQSKITSNPGMVGLSEPAVIYGDTDYAPTVSVTQGAQLNLFGSQWTDTYANDQATNGVVRPTPLFGPGPLDLTSAGLDIASLSTATDSASLALDWSYPSAGGRSGYVNVSYVDSNGPGTASKSNNTAATITATYNGAPFVLGTVTFLNGTSGTFYVPFPSGLLTAFNTSGLLNYLNYTGDFGVGPSEISVSFGTVSGPPVLLTGTAFQMNTTGVSYDDTVSGAKSTLTAVDSALGLTWNFPPANNDPYSVAPPFPWESNKLLFTNGSVGYLANITTPAGIPGVFSSSAIVPDATSQVFLYRWAQFNLTGRGGVLSIEGANVTAFYAYDSNQANNATANALNDVRTADPALWGYLQYWDSLRGVPAYGSSNALGQAFLLLASGNITGATLPDGIFLGGYHIGISVPATSVGSHWFNWSVSPFPTGVANGTGHYNEPDFGPAQTFSDYYGAMSFGAPVVTANATVNATVRIGQLLGFWVTGSDAGTATITQVGGAAYWNASSESGKALGTFSQSGLDLTKPGQTFQFNLTWVINDTVTGLNRTFPHNFVLVLEWNNGNPAGGGVLKLNVTVTVAPSQVQLLQVTIPASTTINLDDVYSTQGLVRYNGTHPASIQLVATPTSGGLPVVLGLAQALPGAHFSILWGGGLPLSQFLSAGTTYLLSVNATYNGYTVIYDIPGEYSVPAAASPAKNFLTQVIFGLPLWVWLAIAAAIVVGLVLFLLLARRTAVGKLVECGECGNLIPEDATVCPKCGAEFEADLIRCSRCASTIPADSKVCPECAAQLLGKPGEGEAEPERQGYADFTEKYRAEAKRELGENYSEGAFWDWWKRQPTYTSFSQWKLQQGQGTPRSGMSAPPAETAPEAPVPPPRGGGGAAMPPARAAGPAATPPAGMTAPPAAAPSAAPAGNLKPCPNCGKEIPPEYLVCPFCGAVTQ